MPRASRKRQRPVLPEETADRLGATGSLSARAGGRRRPRVHTGRQAARGTHGSGVVQIAPGAAGSPITVFAENHKGLDQ